MFVKKSNRPHHYYFKYKAEATPELIEKAHKALERASVQYKKGLISLSAKRRIDARAHRLINPDFIPAMRIKD